MVPESERPHPRRIDRRRVGLIDPAGNFVVGEHVVIVLAPFAGWAGSAQIPSAWLPAGARWKQRQITVTSPFQNAITTLTLGFPPSSVSSCTVTHITTLGFFARAFVHSRSIISAFSTSVSRRRMKILRDKSPCSRRAAEQGDEDAPFHSITSSAATSSLSGTVMPSIRAVRALMTNSNFDD